MYNELAHNHFSPKERSVVLLIFNCKRDLSWVNRSIKRCNCHAKNHTKFIQRILNGENIAKHFQDPIYCNLKDSVVMTVGTSFLKIIVWAGFEFFQQFSQKSSGSDPLNIKRSSSCFNKHLVKKYQIIKFCWWISILRNSVWFVISILFLKH